MDTRGDQQQNLTKREIYNSQDVSMPPWRYTVDQIPFKHSKLKNWAILHARLYLRYPVWGVP